MMFASKYEGRTYRPVPWLLLLLVPPLHRAVGISIDPPPSRVASTGRTSRAVLFAGLINEENAVESNKLCDNLIQSLDLVPLLRAVSNHAGTRRGRDALLSLVGEAESNKQTRLSKKSKKNSSSARRRVIDTLQYKAGDELTEKSNNSCERSFNMDLASVAQSAGEAREEYEMVEQALLALNNKQGLVYPPLYGAESSPWNTNPAETDFDSWLSISVDDWTLEYVLQADQVVNNLLEVRAWADNFLTKTWLPGLSALGRNIPIEKLLPLHKEIEGTVEIVRGRSFSDPKGKSSYAFRLNPEMFPTLNYLYEREAQLIEAIDRELALELRKLSGSNDALVFQGRNVLSIPNSAASSDLGILRGKSGGRCYVEPHSIVSLGDELSRIQQKVHRIQEEIEQRLFQAIIRSTNVIDAALQWMARLDVIFARAAWGDTLGGTIPTVAEGGRIEVKGFLHPVLALANGSPKSVVPVDLHLSGNGGSNALVISGANGGGKTVALKSFGLVSVLCKLGIPVPSSSQPSSKPTIDFIDDVLVEVGDKQSVIEGESTLMARLNSCASVIERVSRSESVLHSKTCLVLLDELGGGTDPNAGSAIAQAVLEKLIECRKCRIVATTHSPQLKALSLESSHFGCATVVMKRDPASPTGIRQPTFQLEYGSIGDSHALAAAHRCKPSLPDDVLSRAAELMSSDSSKNNNETRGKNQIRELTQKLEKETQVASDARVLAEQNLEDSKLCRNCMLSLSESYVQHLSMLEQRLDNVFQELSDDESKDRIEVIGDTLSELRAIKKKVKSDKELLQERGLRIAPDSYEFSNGESVVIIAKGEWEGEMAKIVMADTETAHKLESNEVLVLPSFTAYGGLPSPPLTLRRYEVAIWDYDSIWDVDSKFPSATSVRESKRKLYDALSSIKSNSDPKPMSIADGSNPEASKFTSSRQRKAAREEKKKKKKSKKRRKK